MPTHGLPHETDEDPYPPLDPNRPNRWSNPPTFRELAELDNPAEAQTALEQFEAHELDPVTWMKRIVEEQKNANKMQQMLSLQISKLTVALEESNKKPLQKSIPIDTGHFEELIGRLTRRVDYFHDLLSYQRRLQADSPKVESRRPLSAEQIKHIYTVHHVLHAPQKIEIKLSIAQQQRGPMVVEMTPAAAFYITQKSEGITPPAW